MVDDAWTTESKAADMFALLSDGDEWGSPPWGKITLYSAMLYTNSTVEILLFYICLFCGQGESRALLFKHSPHQHIDCLFWILCNWLIYIIHPLHKFDQYIRVIPADDPEREHSLLDFRRRTTREEEQPEKKNNQRRRTTKEEEQPEEKNNRRRRTTRGPLPTTSGPLALRLR